MAAFRTHSAIGFGLLVCFGCTRVPPADDCYVRTIVHNQIDKDVCWNRCGKDDRVDDVIQMLLQQELTIDAAVQIALLNNPEIQAIFEEIGIAHADLVQAGLFQNPIFEGYVRFPDHPSLHLNTAFSVTQNFLDLFLIPLRQKIASVELEQAHLRVSNAVLNLAFEVQETFYSFQFEQIKRDLLDSLGLATEAASQLATAQREQGNINDLEFHSRMNEYLESQLELTQNQNELIRLREKLNKLLGFSTSELHCRILGHLPELPIEEVPAECLESMALSQRLDLQIARRELERIARTLGVKQWWAYTNAAVGISTEHEAEGFQETGPALIGSIPIFNYGQADRARLHSMYRQRRERLKALEIEVLSDLRAARDQLNVNRSLVLTYKKDLLPLQEQIVAMSQRFYNTMTLGVYQLLDAKRKELQIQISYHTQLKKYWVSRVELDRALGGSFYLANGDAQSRCSLEERE